MHESLGSEKSGVAVRWASSTTVVLVSAASVATVLCFVVARGLAGSGDAQAPVGFFYLPHIWMAAFLLLVGILWPIGRVARLFLNRPGHASWSSRIVLPCTAFVISAFVAGALLRHWLDYVSAEQLSFSPARLLQIVEGSSDSALLIKISEHPECPGNALASLASNGEPMVRFRVALHANTPMATLRALAADRDAHVRECVAANPRTSPDILGILLKDENPRVRLRARRRAAAGMESPVAQGSPIENGVFGDGPTDIR